MASDIMQPIRIPIDLGSGLAQTPMRMQLMKGDKKANRVIVALTDGKNEADLTGVTVSGSFIRPGDSAEIPLVGTVDGNRAIVELVDACYAQEGYCEINVALTMGETKRTIVALTGNVLSKGSGAYVDVSGVIPSIDDIIAQYAEMKRVTEETQEAANAATTAASKAPYVDPISKNWMIWDASDGKYVDSGVTAQGEPGPQGPPGQNGTGSGTVTGVKVEGQTYQPDGAGVVTLPKSGAQIDDTTPSAEKVYSSQKTQYELNQLSQQKANKAGWTANKLIGTDASGNLVAQDPPETDGGDADTLGGKAPGFYTPYTNLADNSDFEHWVAKAGIGGKHGNETYGGDRWILTSGTITGEANADGDGYSNITLNGTLVQVVPSPPAVATAFIEMVSGTAEISYDASKGEIIIISNGGVIKNVLLLEGEWTEKPEYISKKYAEELAECRRYFQVVVGTDYNAYNVGWWLTSTSFRCIIPIDTEMRIKAPSVSMDLSKFQIISNKGANTPHTPKNVDVACAFNSGISLTFETESLQGSVAGLFRAGDKNGGRPPIYINADLPRR